MERRTILAAAVAGLWAAQAWCEVPEGVLLKDGKPASYTSVANDASGCRWDVDSSGGINDGTNDAYDGGMYTSVNNNSTSAGPLVQDPSGRECQIGPATYPNGVQAWRQIYVPEKEPYCRIIDIYTNNGMTDQTLDIQIRSNMGGGVGSVLTSSGAGTATEKDWAAAAADSSGGNSSRPGVVHVFATPASRVRTFNCTTGSSTMTYRIRLPLPSGKTVRRCAFSRSRFAPPGTWAR